MKIWMVVATLSLFKNNFGHCEIDLIQFMPNSWHLDSISRHGGWCRLGKYILTGWRNNTLNKENKELHSEIITQILLQNLMCKNNYQFHKNN